MTSPFKEYFANKRVVVTGAGKGIGRALVKELNDLGAEVYAVTRSQQDLNTLTQECPRIHPIQLDVSDWDSTRQILSAQLPGNIDVLVNNAAVLHTGNIIDVTSEDFDSIFNTNLKAVINVTQVCVKKMIASGTKGIVINVSSVAGIRPMSVVPLYSASKSALDALTKIMAVDFGRHQIRVIGFNPAGIRTNMTAAFQEGGDMEQRMREIGSKYVLGEMFIPMPEVVSTILFMASGMAGMMTGSSVVLDGGFLST